MSKSEYGKWPEYPYRPLRSADFSVPQRLSVSELRRLAPAAESTRSMICVQLNHSSAWEVWGLLDTGTNWWDFLHHESGSGTPPPSNLTITSMGPGELVLSAEGEVLLSLRSGALYSPRAPVLWNGPISEYLEPARAKLHSSVLQALGSSSWSSDGMDEDYPQRFYNFCLSRILNSINERRHGGTLLVVPSEIRSTDSRLLDRVNIKYACSYSFAWDMMLRNLKLHHDYFDLFFPISDSNKPVSQDDFHKLWRIEFDREHSDEALADCFHFIGALASVDGAVVMTRDLTVLGFGAEVIAQSPTLKDVQLATNAEATETRPVSIESYGTRHRSVFRFCSSYEDAIAFVVSQDGGLRACRRTGDRVLFWPDISVGMHGA
jgi:hypothetical protein